MVSRTYYQKVRGAEGGTEPSRAAAGVPPVPGALRWMWALFGVYAVLLAALPLQMTLDTGALAQSVLSENPGLDDAYLGAVVAAVLAYSWGMHAVTAAVAAWFLAKACAGRQWARIALSVLVVFAAGAGLASAAAGPEYHWAVIATEAVHVAMLGMLWVPGPVRRFFAAHCAAARSR